MPGQWGNTGWGGSGYNPNVHAGQTPIQVDSSPGIKHWAWPDGTPLSDDELNQHGLQNWDAGRALGVNPNKVTSATPGAQIDTSAADQQRAQMGDLVAQLQQQAATGNGSWEGALKAATDRSQNTASALGQSTPNTDYSSALMNIGNAQAGARQRAVGQANVLRNEQKMSAQGELGGLLGAQGASDEEQANAQARARQQVGATNLALIDQAQGNEQNLQKGIGQMAGPFASDGGVVPGKAQYPGDDTRNDTVTAEVDSSGRKVKLSPDEVILPRSIAHNPEAAADFVRALNAGHKPVADRMADGGSTGMGSYDTPGGDIALNFLSPGVGNVVSYGNLRGQAGVGAGSIENGGMLDTSQFGQTASARRGLEGLQAQSADLYGFNNGPSVTPQMTEDANAEAIAKGMQAKGPAASAVTGATNEAQAGGGAAASKRAQEQAAGQRALGATTTQGRAQELSMAEAQQQAAWANTMQNLGLSLQNQAALRNMFAGAGQAVTSASGAHGAGSDITSMGGGSDMGGDGGVQDSGVSPGAGEDSTGVTDMGGGSDMGGDGGIGGLAFGGAVRAMAGGGKIPPPSDVLPPPSDSVKHAAYVASITAKHRESMRRPHAGYRPRPAPDMGGPPPEGSLARQNDDDLREELAVQRAYGGSVPGYADGGGIDFLEPRRDSGTQTFTGAELGLGGGFSPNATISYSPPEVSMPEAPPATESQIREARRGGVPVATGLKPEAPAVETLVDTGKRVNGKPVVEAKTGYVTPEVRSFTPDAAASSTPAPAAAAKPRTGGAGVAIPKSEDRSDIERSELERVAGETGVEVQKASLEAAAAQERQKVNEQYAIEKKQRASLANQRTNDAMTRLQAAQDEMNRVDANIDRGHYWANQTTAQKILGVIGLALGAAGTGPDGINRSAEMMNKAIDQDIEAQKANYEARIKKAGQRVATAQTYYSMAREAGMSELAATEAAKSAALEGIANRLDAQTAAFKGTEAKLKGQGLANVIRGAAADKRDSAKKELFDEHYRNAQLGIEGQRLDIEREKAGKGGGLSEGERKAVGDVTAAAKDALGLIDSIQGTLGRTQSPIPGKTAVNQHFGSDAAQLDTDTAQLVAKMKDINKLGQIGPADKALLEEAIGDPKAVFTLEGTKRAKLDRVKQIIRDSVKNEREARGLQ